jgi:hypothetical protein
MTFFSTDVPSSNNGIAVEIFSVPGVHTFHELKSFGRPALRKQNMLRINNNFMKIVVTSDDYVYKAE